MREPLVGKTGARSSLGVARTSSTMMSPLTPFKDCDHREARDAVSFTRARRDANPQGRGSHGVCGLTRCGGGEGERLRGSV